MSVEFNHNGNSYEIINDNEVRLTNMPRTFGDNDFIPKYAMYRDKRYTVTEIGLVKDEYSASVFRVKSSYSSSSDLTPEMNSLTQLVIPNSVKKIHPSAFYNCKGLTTLTIPDSVTEIGKEAFKFCYSLLELKIPDSVTEIGEMAFAYCYKLLELKIPNSVTKIGEGAFWHCHSLLELKIPNSVTEIGAWAFEEPRSLKKLKLPNKIKKIPKGMFANGSMSNEVLTSLTIPSSVEEIGERAFDAFKNLKEVEICNDPGEVMIAVNAFPSSAKITYTGKKAQPKGDAPKTDVDATPAPTIDLDKLIAAVVADGVITDKERSVVLKKATAAGYDADEVEVLLDGKLAEIATKEKPNPKPAPKVESKIKVTPVITNNTYKEKAVIDGVTIGVNSNNSIEISNADFPSVKEGLRCLAEKAGFKVDPKWNTQQLGKKLIAHINGK